MTKTVVFRTLFLGNIEGCYCNTSSSAVHIPICFTYHLFSREGDTQKKISLNALWYVKNSKTYHHILKQGLFIYLYRICLQINNIIIKVKENFTLQWGNPCFYFVKTLPRKGVIPSLFATVHLFSCLSWCEHGRLNSCWSGQPRSGVGNLFACAGQMK